MINPIMVEAARGRHPESHHRGAAVVVDSLGHVIRSWGNIHNPVFGRSALKFIQALPLVESRATGTFHLGSEEIALSCASHHGEDMHIRALEVWLKKIGKDERILECGIHPPLHLVLAKKEPFFHEKTSVLHNQCSGKHLGFITTALHRNEPVQGYTGKDHPAQRRVEQTLSEMVGADLTHVPYGTDGCGVPAFAIPLYNIAFAMARMADSSHLHYPRQKAIHQILSAVADHPEMISGTAGFDTKLIKLTQGHILCKGGAGGVEVAVIPSLGLGIALKIDDGSGKAAEIAFLAILRSLGCLDEDLYDAMIPRSPILTHKGKTVGFLQSTHFTTLPPETSGH